MNGERLRVAREAHWMTQTDLSEASGVPTSTVSKIEHGLYGPGADKFSAQLADALDMPVSYFSDEPMPDVADGRYRKQSQASAKLKKSVIAHAKQVAAVMAEADRRYPIRKATIVPIEPGQVSLEDAPAIAAELRELMGLSQEGPVSNVTRACERAGIAVVTLPVFETSERSESTRHFSGFSTWPGLGADSMSRPIVLLSSTLPGDVQRASLAHEVSHIYAHTRNRSVDDKLAERQAWDIGGNFLVPIAEAREILSGGHVTLDRLKRMKAVYGVTVKFLITYCARNGIIDQEKSVSLNKQYTSRGWNKSEPVEVIREEASFFPAVINRMLADHVDVGMQRLEVARIAAEGTKVRKARKGGVLMRFSVVK